MDKNRRAMGENIRPLPGETTKRIGDCRRGVGASRVDDLESCAAACRS